MSTPSATDRIVSALAALAVVLLAYQAYTLVGWLSDGPHQVTADRDRDGGAWVAARVIEVVVATSVAGWVVHVVRERRRDGRLGSDGLLIVGMFSAAFWDPIYNWLAPAWLYSSNLLNVNDWLGNAPGIVNPAAGSQPWPIVIVLVGYPLWGVGFALLVDRGMHAARARFPALGAGATAGVGFVLASLLTCASYSLFKALGLMTAPGYRLDVLGGELLLMSCSGGVVFWALACVRHFRDAEGRTFVERPASARRRVLASIGLCQLIVVVGWGVLTVPFSLHSMPYPELPAHVVNGLCDAPGVQGTDYGPCPGSPGFRLPLASTTD